MATGIPAVSPELGTEEECSNTFFIEDQGCLVRTLEAQYPLVWTTLKKIGSQLDIKASFKPKKNGRTEADFTIENKGLSTAEDDWITINARNQTGSPANFTID